MEVNIRQAKATLSSLVDSAFRGETVFITIRGKGKIQLVPEPEHTPMGGYGMYSHLQDKLSQPFSQEQDDREDEEMAALFGITD